LECVRGTDEQSTVPKPSDHGLQAFINAVFAQSGNQLTVEEAEQLAAAAERIIDLLLEG